MMKLILLVTLAALAAADVSHLNKLVGDSQLSYSTTASPELSLPFKEHQDFNAQFGSIGAIGYSTPAPFLAGGLVSSTPAPFLDGGLVSSTPAPYLDGGLVSSTPAPFVNEAFVSSTPSPLFGGLVSSTVSPSLDLNSVGAANDVDFNSAGLSFQVNGVGVSNVGYSNSAPIADSGLTYSSTPAPQTLNYGPLAAYNSNSFNLVTPITTSGGSINEAFGQYDYQTRPQEVNKQAFFYSAPEDYEPVQTRIRVAPETPVKKNVRYIFIKAPSAPSLGRVEIAAPPQAEEKTVVYVLAKKPELEQQIVVKSAPTTEAPKPEVYFLKYKNEREAEEAVARARSGNVEGRVSAYNHEGSNDFVGSINKESVRAQPIVDYSNEVSQEAVVGSTSGSGFGNLNYGGALSYGVGDSRFHFVNQPAAVQLNRGFSYTTPAPIQYNAGLSYSTASPIQFQGFSNPNPTVNIGSGFKSVFSGYGGPIISSSSEPSFVSSTTAAPIQFQSFSTPSVNLGSGFKSVFSGYGGPIVSSSSEPSFVSSTTAAPIQFQSFSTPSVNIGSGFKSVFSGYNSPIVSGSSDPSFVSSTVAPEVSVSSTPAPFSTYGLKK